MDRRLVADLLQDLADFRGLPVDIIRDVCYRQTEDLARIWRERKPQSPGEILRYYLDGNALYLGDTAFWHATCEGRQEWMDRMIRVLRELRVVSVTDYGCGIGTDSLVLAQEGFSVLGLDLPGEMLRFARWRADKYGVGLAHFKEIKIEIDPPLIPLRDCTILIDVLEHIPDYQRLLKRFMRASWLLVISAPFRDRANPNADPIHPQHLLDEPVLGLERFMEQEGWEAFDGLFWAPKQLRNTRQNLHAEIEKERKARYG